MQQVKLFPTIEEVLQNPTGLYKVVFFPLLTLNSATAKIGIKKVHFISFNGGVVPEIEVFDDNFDYNFLRFKVVGDKYKFEGDFSQMPLIKDAVAWYKEAETIYCENKEKFFTETQFTIEEDQRRRKVSFEYFNYVKSVTNYFVTRDKFLETGKFIQGGSYTYGESNHEREKCEVLGGTYDDEHELIELKEVVQDLGMQFADLKFCGNVTGYNYISSGEDEILLFANDRKQEVLQYFLWS